MALIVPENTAADSRIMTLRMILPRRAFPEVDTLLSQANARKLLKLALIRLEHD